MKLISLNLWGGSQGDILFEFLKKHSADADIFCFQEVFHNGPKNPPDGVLGNMNIFNQLTELLPNFTGYFVMTSKNVDLVKQVDFMVEAGQAIFVKNELNVTAKDCFAIYGNLGDSANPMEVNLPTALQRIEILVGAEKLQIYNFHGLAYPGDKLDTPERLAQSEKIISILSASVGAKILCGDFNLSPETQSIKMLGQNRRDLIRDYKIENTRNEISWKQYSNKQYYADFTFVTDDIKVLNFDVPYCLVSDHLPMILDFSL